MTVERSFHRPDPALVEALKGQSPATLHEAIGKRGAMTAAIKPLYPGMRVCGPALTVSCGPADNLMIHVAVALAQPGDVLVVDFKGMVEAGPWGDVLTASAQARGIAGLVIDGAVRDAQAIRDMGFPVFARGICMKGTTKVLAYGDVGTPIVCGGVAVAPGDVVAGDDDGVVVVPQDEAASALERARAREAQEEAFRERLRAGATTIELLGLSPVLKAAGINL